MRRRVWMWLLGISVAAMMSVPRLAYAPQIPSNKVYLWNRGTQDVRFLLSDDQQTWREVGLSSDTNEMFDVPRDALYMRLATEGRELGYKLEKRKRYEIFWNEAANRWELAELPPR